MPEHDHHDQPKFEYRANVFESKSMGERLREFAKSSPYFFIAAAVNLSLLALATVWKLASEEPKKNEVQMQTAVSKTIEAEPEKKEEIQKRDIFEERDAAVETVDTEINTNEPELTFPDDNFVYGDHNETDNGEDYGMAKGDGSQFNFANSSGKNLFDSIGVGGGSGRSGRGGYGGPFGGRRNMTVRGGKGSTAKTESAVEAGLRWLARHQDEDGSWSPENFQKACFSGGTACEHKGYPEHQVGVTALSLLAFLGAGYDQRSQKQWTDPFTKRVIKVGDVVKNGLKFLRSSQDEQGSFVPSANAKWGYNHSIAALCMTEAYGLSRSPLWKESAQKAIDNLIAGQNPAPGGSGYLAWRYRPQSGDNDISVTGWCVMALKSAELAGLKFSQGSMEGAFNFCEEVTDKTNGQVGYTKREEAGQQVKQPGKNDDYQNHPALSAVGMCVRTFSQHNMEDPMLKLGADLMKKDLPEWNKQKKTNDYYYWYYASLALNQFDGPDSPRATKGEYWKPWNETLKKALLDNQVNNPKSCSDGSWDGDDRWGFEGGRVYATAINTLTFEVYYRYGNAFGTTKKKK
ncbi:MAG: terpene cyclase/mutase family protein [Planctomycetes bacterium]|nr:terpene cyclase/mutase family protein [Planctomycetota bacterium]